jgi:hypothetical protein
MSGGAGQVPRHSCDTVAQFPAVSKAEEGVMGILMISCPSTGRAVSTGIEMAGVDQLPTVTATIECSACGGVHEWSKDTAWLAEVGDSYRKTASSKAAADTAAARAANGRLLGVF